MEAKHTQAEEEFKDAVSHLGNLYEEAKDSLNSLTIIKHEGLYYNQLYSKLHEIRNVSAATLQENFKLKQDIETIQSDVDSVVEEVNKLKQEKEELIKMLEKVHEINRIHFFNGHNVNDQILTIIQKHKKGGEE